MKNKKTFDSINFKWNVWNWHWNHDKLEIYDVVPMFIRELKALKKKDIPKTKEEFNDFLKREAQYHFWSKCEYEMIIHGWPVKKNDIKVDIYDQLQLNWDAFVDAFWSSLNDKTTKSSHRKQRGRTAPNRAISKNHNR